MSEDETDAHARAHRSAETFERTLIVSFVLILTITTTFMPKTYIPDRWMITGWVCLLAGFTATLASHFVGQFHLRRGRIVMHALASLCLVLGLAATIVFVSEGDDGGGDDDTYAQSDAQ